MRCPAQALSALRPVIRLLWSSQRTCVSGKFAHHNLLSVTAELDFVTRREMIGIIRRRWMFGRMCGEDGY